jgi:hypothetical protein
MIQDPEDEAFNEIEKQAKMRQEAVRSLNRKRQIENADRVHQGYEAMTQEKALQALHSENERLGLYKEAYAQTQEPAATLAVRWHAPVGKVAYVLEVNLPLGIHKLYPATPQRTWVGLTDDEFQYCVELKNPEAIAEEVEAKLKEKNT